MFGKLMNNYYYGKAGKGDYTPDDLPKNRWQLFMEMLRTRLSALVRLNLIYMVVWLPCLILVTYTLTGTIQMLGSVDDAKAGTTEIVEIAEGETMEYTFISEQQMRDAAYSTFFMTLILLIPCIAITGPATAGISYVTRNWARDEHAFIWTDFKDALKANWKQSLVISCITSVLPLVVFMGWRFYGEMAVTTPLMALPQVIIVMLGIVWSISVTYMYPLLVSYDLKLKDVLRNGLLLAIARLPMSVGIRLLHMMPAVVIVGLTFLFNNLIFLFLGPLVWYVFFGFGLSRFVTASYTNAVFDKYINNRIEGAQVNRGLATDTDDDDEDEEEAAE